MTSTISVPLSVKTFLDLAAFLRAQGSARDPVAVIEDAVLYWMENAAWKQEDLMPEVVNAPRHQGYLWRKVLLPPGTKIRTQHKRQTFHAEIIDGHFVYNGQSMTPPEFANTVAAGTTRNAWKVLDIKRPEDRDFVPAEVLRREREAEDTKRAELAGITLSSLGLVPKPDEA